VALKGEVGPISGNIDEGNSVDLHRVALLFVKVTFALLAWPNGTLPKFRLIGETKGTNSKAPMSQPLPCGRAIPRWSVNTGLPNVSVQALGGIALTAELVESNAIVRVGPPLFCRLPGLRPAVLLLFWSPVWVRKLQVLSSERLYPSEVPPPEQLPFVP
jgi:hypothetical protein